LESQGGASAYYREYRRHRRRAEAAQAFPKVSATKREVAGCPSVLHSEGTESSKSANRDANYLDSQIKSGRYVIFPAHANRGANKDAIVAEIYLISNG
jgi:hypothetical protein